MEFRKVTEKDAKQLCSLIEEMNNNLSNKAWFITMESDMDNVTKMINKERFYILGAFDGEKLAGIASLDYKNGKMPEKYEFPDWCNIKEMVEFAFSIVALEYRGKGLMFEMLQEINKIAIEQGYKYACCTVHNDNHPSKKNLLKIGFEYYMSIAQDTEFPRDIMLMKLNSKDQLKNPNENVVRKWNGL